jgi:hypothetical protein
LDANHNTFIDGLEGLSEMGKISNALEDLAAQVECSE